MRGSSGGSQESRRKLIEAQATELENKRLKALLRLTDEVDDPIGDPDRRLLLRHSSAGSPLCRPAPRRESGRPAGARADGLIGRVIETGRWASRVLLVTDGASNVPVRLVRDGTPAIAGRPWRRHDRPQDLEVGQNPFRRGDVLVTSGPAGSFRPTSRSPWW
jgi:rod shape-determining protein MreC